MHHHQNLEINPLLLLLLLLVYIWSMFRLGSTHPKQRINSNAIQLPLVLVVVVVSPVLGCEAKDAGRTS